MIGLEHVGICARDTISLKAWYVNLFQFKIVYDNQKEKPTFFLLMEDGSMIEIYPMETEGVAGDNKRQGLRHLAFETDDIEKQYNRLIEYKVEIIEDLKVSPTMVKTVFFKDLEGNIIHFIQRPKPLY